MDVGSFKATPVVVNDEEEDNTYPETYSIKFMPSEIDNVFRNILGEATVNQVIGLMRDYVRDSIEPVGWKAVWYPKFDGKEFPVNAALFGHVIDVYPETFEAGMSFTRLLSPDMTELSYEQFMKINKIMESLEHYRVPLIELKVVEEHGGNQPIDTQAHYDNAVVIEQLCFFFNTIWHPYDEYDENQDHKTFFHDCFRSRTQFALAVKNKNVEKSCELRYNALLKRSHEVLAKLKAFEKIADNQDSSNDEAADDGLNHCDTDELEALQLIRLKRQLKDLEQKMCDLQDTFTRFIYHELHPMCEEAYEDNNKPVVHLVMKTLSLTNIKNSLDLIEVTLNTKLFGLNINRIPLG